MSLRYYLHRQVRITCGVTRDRRINATVESERASNPCESICENRGQRVLQSPGRCLPGSVIVQYHGYQARDTLTGRHVW